MVFASAACGGIYAWHAGLHFGAAFAAIMVCFAISLELCKPLAVRAMFEAFRSWAIVRGAALALLAGVAVAYSLTAETTLMSMARGDLVAERQASTKTAKSIDGQRTRIEAELGKLANVRPAATIKADLAGILADQRLGNCKVLDGPRTKAACPRVASLRAELGNAERRDKLEGDLAAVQPNGAVMATDRPSDPGAHAVSVFLTALGFATPAGLSEWLSIVGVISLEVGSALAGLLVASVGRQSSQQIANVVDANAGNRIAAQPARSGDVPKVRVDSKTPAMKPRAVSKAKRSKRAKGKRLGQSAPASKEAVKLRLVDSLKAEGGKLDDASVRGVARLIGAKKSTVHNAVAGLIAAGVVARVGTDLVLAAAA